MKIVMRERSEKPITPKLVYGIPIFDVMPSDFEQIPIDDKNKQMVVEYNFDISNLLYISEKLGKEIIPQISVKMPNEELRKLGYNQYVIPMENHVEYSNDYNSEDYKPDYIRYAGIFQRICNNTEHVAFTELVNYTWETCIDLKRYILKVSIILDLSAFVNINICNLTKVDEDMELIVNIFYHKYAKRKYTILSGKFDFENTDFYKEVRMGRIVTSPVSRNQFIEIMNYFITKKYPIKYINTHKYFELTKNFLRENYRNDLMKLGLVSLHAFQFHVDFNVECIYGNCDENYRWNGKKYHRKLYIDKSTINIDVRNNKLIFSGFLYDKKKKT